MKKAIHVVPAPQGGWNGKQAGAASPMFHTETKLAAVDKGRDKSRSMGAELVIHGKDGKIQSRDSHGNDPYPPKG
jgi:hypothetical protein